MKGFVSKKEFSSTFSNKNINKEELDQFLDHIRKEIHEFLEQKTKSDKTDIPSYVFNETLSPLESIIKFLKEGFEELNFRKIGKLLNRNEKSIWLTYKRATTKMPTPFKPEETKFFIPLQIISTRKYSVLESIVKHLKEHYELSYHQIGELIKRNERTVWTVYKRSKQKDE